jgi:hypothetical protein
MSFVRDLERLENETSRRVQELLDTIEGHLLGELLGEGGLRRKGDASIEPSPQLVALDVFSSGEQWNEVLAHERELWRPIMQCAFTSQ